ncbi:hypothetical protein JTB14_033424 [Gonioctena quinquepunctata]|nr:hypothetical protein JTB14_033424 [Gonioctena quinquepunctata]
MLAPQQERFFVQRIIRYSEIGLPLTSDIVRHQTYRYCVRFNIANNFSKKKEMAGKDWLLLFLRRHPDDSKRKAQTMNPARVQKMNHELDSKDKPQSIYNMDEKGCRLTIHHQQTVLALEGSKRVHLVAPKHAARRAAWDILPTPDGTKPVNKKVNRRKAINYKAQKVTKHFYRESVGQPSTLETLKLLEYCSICDTDKQMDMRLCFTCLTYYHEECVGLTADGEEDFECPSCS